MLVSFYFSSLIRGADAAIFESEIEQDMNAIQIYSRTYESSLVGRIKCWKSYTFDSMKFRLST